MFYENFMHTYFWVFLVLQVIAFVFNLAVMATRTHSQKEAAREKIAIEGVQGPKFTAIIAWTLWFLSWGYV